MKPVILGLDFGGTTGWAVTWAGSIVSGVWKLAPAPGESPGMRYIRLRGYLVELRRAFPELAVVAYEEAHHRGKAATQYAHGYIATLQAWCVEQKIDHTAFHSATLKKWATGKGNAKKEAMVAAGREKFGKPDAEHDEIDALWVLDLAIERYGREAEPTGCTEHPTSPVCNKTK